MLSSNEQLGLALVLMQNAALLEVPLFIARDGAARLMAYHVELN